VCEQSGKTGREKSLENSPSRLGIEPGPQKQKQTVKSINSPTELS